MSVESCTAFLRIAQEDPKVRQQMKSLTGIPELIRLGRAHGYMFDQGDLTTASSTAGSGPRSLPDQEPGTAGEATKLYHYEFPIDDIPGFAAIADELPRLKIKPSTVDLAAFDQGFRDDDLASTSVTPSSPEYLRWKADLRPDPNDRRDFHLINLDNHVAHPQYDEYLAAKTRVVATLENLFGGEVRFSGSMWYPPTSYRLWHTNEDQPGWRMYLIDVDADFDDPQNTSFFRYQHPATGEMVTLRERPRMARFFKVEQDPERLFWHCIVNPTRRHRWSFGFAVPATWIEHVPAHS